MNQNSTTQIPKGLVILSKSGSGKTKLLNLLTNQHFIGEVLLMDYNPTSKILPWELVTKKSKTIKLIVMERIFDWGHAIEFYNAIVDLLNTSNRRTPAIVFTSNTLTRESFPANILGEKFDVIELK